MFEETGCDGVMVGRGAISNPWRLRRITEAVQGKELTPDPSLHERVEVALEHLRLVIEHEQREAKLEESQTGRPARSPEDIENLSVRAMRGQIPLYIKHQPGAAAFRGKLVRADSYREIEELLRGFEAQQAERLELIR